MTPGPLNPATTHHPPPATPARAAATASATAAPKTAAGHPHAALGADPGQDLGVADVGAVAEVAFEQRLDDGVLDALLTGEADQPMGVHGIGRARDAVEVKFQADGGRGLGDALVELLRALEAAKLGDAVLLALDALGRHLGVELEGMPGDGDGAVLAGEQVEGALELALVLGGKWPRACVNPMVLEKSKLQRWQPFSMERGPGN